MGIAISALAVLIGCFAQAAAGTGLGLISGGILVVFLGRESAIVTLAIISIPTMLAILWQNRKQIEWQAALLMSLPVVAVTPLFAWGMRQVHDSYLLVAAGVGVLLSVYALLRGFRTRRLRGKTGAVLAGLAAAVLNMLSGSGGPPPAIYAVNAEWNPTATRGTLQVFFLAMAVVTGFSLGLPELDGATVAALGVAAVIGTVVGMLLARHLPARAARVAILMLAGLGGCVLLGSGLTEIATGISTGTATGISTGISTGTAVQEASTETLSSYLQTAPGIGA